MIENYSVLIVEDIPVTYEAYKKILEGFSLKNEFLRFKVDVAHDCESAYNKLFSSSKTTDFDFVFLDIRLPPYKEANIFSGEDLGVKIRQLLPDLKIIVFTFYRDNYRLHNIFKNLNPDGFLVKNDFKSEELARAIRTIALNDTPYYSKTVLNMLRLQELYSDFLLDKNDRQLLYELSMGTKITDMSKKINLAKPTIEKRIYKLEDIFDVRMQKTVKLNHPCRMKVNH